MAIIVKLSLYTLLAFCIGFMLYSKYALDVFVKNPREVIPQPFRSLYGMYEDTPLYNSVLIDYERRFYLTKGSVHLGKMYMAVYVSVYPMATASLFITLSSMSNLWYLDALSAGISLLIPFFVINSKVNKEVVYARASMVPQYKTAFTLLDRGNQVYDVMQMISYNVNGPLKITFRNFLDNYNIDRSMAYHELSLVVGDIYCRNFCRALENYEEHGENPSESIKNNAIMAEKFYSKKKYLLSSFKVFRTLSMVSGGMVILMVMASKMLSAGMGNSSNGISIFFYIAGAIVVFSICSTYIYEG